MAYIWRKYSARLNKSGEIALQYAGAKQETIRKAYFDFNIISIVYKSGQ